MNDRNGHRNTQIKWDFNKIYGLFEELNKELSGKRGGTVQKDAFSRILRRIKERKEFKEDEMSVNESILVLKMLLE